MFTIIIQWFLQKSVQDIEYMEEGHKKVLVLLYSSNNIYKYRTENHIYILSRLINRKVSALIHNTNLKLISREFTAYIVWEAPEDKYAIGLEQVHYEQSFFVSRTLNIAIRETQGYYPERNRKSNEIERSQESNFWPSMLWLLEIWFNFLSYGRSNVIDLAFKSVNSYTFTLQQSIGFVY